MSAEYKLEILPSAQKELRSLHDPLFKRIAKQLRSLALDPRPRGCRKLVGTISDYRIRVGDYRIAYEVDDSTRRVVVYRIRHRREVYQ